MNEKEQAARKFWKKVSETYQNLVKEDFLEENVAFVKSATPLSEKTQENLRKELEQKFEKSLKLESKVEPELIGGLVVIVDDKIIDRSISGKLSKISEQITKNFSYE